jgi:ubiquinone/menaquinone biosynthesis C-methylase UbiE
MLIKLANLAMKFTPTRKLFTRLRYNTFSKTNLGRAWNFMNFGYMWPADQKPPILNPDDEPERLCIQLYHRVAAEVDVKDKTVLEVGCGRGGGAAYIAKYLGPASMTGLDLSKHALAHCRSAHVAPNLEFKMGDAEELPFNDQTFDVVLNVESSHCYTSAAKFFSEAARVLKEGGTFFWQDVKAAKDDDARLSNTARDQVPSSLTLVRETDITAQVLQALDIMNEDRKRNLTAGLPSILHRATFEEWALKGSRFYDDMATRRIVYLSRTYVKRRR